MMLYHCVLPHTLVFKNLAITSRGAYRVRNVWYVFLSSMPLQASDCARLLQSPSEWGNCKVGVGEIAPLYDLSEDYTDNFDELIDVCCRKCFQSGCPDFALLKAYPSIRFGAETAWLSYCSADGLALFDTPFSRGESSLRINGLVWMGSIEQMTLGVKSKVDAGFKCIKCKIGTHDFNQELMFLKQLRRNYPKTYFQLRLDANGAYSVESVEQVLHELKSLDVHSIEQPIKKGQWECMQKICEVSPIPIALDEELIGVNDFNEKRRLLEKIRPQYIVLKPTLHGGIGGTLEWIKLAKQLNVGYWITSALESNVGLNAIAQLASVVEGTEPWQGLGTGGLFEQNIEGLGLKLEGECLKHES